MKKLLLAGAAVLLLLSAGAQAPQQLNYQAVVRDGAGNPLSGGQTVNLRFQIHDGNPTGAVVFQETSAAITNQFGLITKVIGAGNNLAAVNWGNGPKYLQVEIDATGGSTFIDMGTSQLISVPYALYAGNSAAGPAGPTGTQGPQGPTGASGPQGVQGITGSNGDTGPTGAQGLNGLNGLNGDTGPTGAQGQQGLNGATGPTGAQGLNGQNGDTGATGPQGAQGLQGSNGLNGGTGPTGPMGPTGNNGAQGLQGPTGAQGTQGIQGLNGNTGAMGPAGVTGIDGLQGLQGPTGATGTAGLNGSNGLNGNTGPTGLAGAIGLNGNNGDTGPTGAQGLAGPTGAAGTGGLPNGTAAGNTTYWDGTTWRVDNNNIYNNGGNIGIGIATPAAKLHIHPGNVILDLIDQQESGQITIQQGSLAGPGNWIVDGFYSFSGGNKFRIWNDVTGGTYTFMDNGYLGIGNFAWSAQPTAPLHVLGNVRFETLPGTGTYVGIDVLGNLSRVTVAGGLANGSVAGNTPYWNGTTWVTNSSNIFNNGGNVGIGTSTPAEALDITTGNVRIPGANDYKYATPKTHYYSVSPFAFTSEAGNFGTAAVSGNVYFSVGAPANVGYMSAPVNLPDGATVTGVTFYVVDNDGTYDLQAGQLWRNDASTATTYGNSSVMATTPLPASNNSTLVQTCNTATITNPVIDNQNYTYFLRWGTQQANPNMRLVKVLVTYTVSKVD